MSRTATRRSRVGGWFLLFIAVVSLTGAWFTWDTGEAITRQPDGFVDGDTDQNNPDRFRIVSPNVVEDASTGLRRVIPGITESALATLVPENVATDALPNDLRHGFGPRPAFLRAEGIKLDTTVIPIGLDKAGSLAVPRRADLTGWWSGGSVPGENGPTVIVGHYDSKVAAGVFSRLKELQVGDTISVEQTDGGTYTYKVSETEKLHKTAFPTAKVYDKTPSSTLRLVTCGGKWDRKTKHYLDNTVVYAEFLSYEPPPPGFIPAPTTMDPRDTTTSTVFVPDWMKAGPQYRLAAEETIAWPTYQPYEPMPLTGTTTTSTSTTTTSIARTTTSRTTTSVAPATAPTTVAPTEPPTSAVSTTVAATAAAELTTTVAPESTAPSLVPVTAQTTVPGQTEPPPSSP